VREAHNELAAARQLEDGPRIGLDGKTRKLPSRSEKDEDDRDSYRVAFLRAARRSTHHYRTMAPRHSTGCPSASRAGMGRRRWSLPMRRDSCGSIVPPGVTDGVVRSPRSSTRRLLVPHHEAAVDIHRLAGHVVGVAAGEKAYQAGHVLGGFGPAERDERRSSLPGFTGLPAL
jgi:hypothetical protein